MVTRSTTSRVTKPSTSSVTGVGVSSGTPLLLDLFPGAVRAYSTRKLYQNYSGACIRVRRSSDSTEQDFGFIAGVLDTASLATFVGAGNGFVTKWYDQSGNSDAAQAVAIEQPGIVGSGTLYTINSIPALRVYDTKLDFTSLSSPTIAIVAKTDATNNALYVLGGNNQGVFWGGSFVGVNGIGAVDSSANSIQSSVENTNPHLALVLSNATQDAVYVDGSATTGTINTLTTSCIGARLDVSTVDFRGKVGELIIWSSDKSSDQAAIQAAINEYWSIY